ncbi:MFS transporter [Rhizobium sp. P40RR-XXII]|uniref:MFS transporter n=1 Tax=Rhizobium sp. P40RR-XXII TaxID=2726739 RepID=UPI0014575EC5|nr:MFS transporter [Rhizobium sp. P40RR-XXII]NLS20739.1 MFS transporter [Rhizobium sp. P40RR-XXII]
MNLRWKAIAFAGFSFLSFTVVGMGIVLPAWAAFHLGGSQLIGILFFAGSAAGIVAAPIAGHVVDSFSRTSVSAFGQLLRILGLLLLAIATKTTGLVATTFLIASSIVSVFGFILLSGALGGVLQALVPPKERVAFVFRLSIAKQSGIAIGTGACGLLIQAYGAAWSALGAILLILLSTPLVLAVCVDILRQRTTETLLKSSLEALHYLARNHQALSASCGVGLAFALVQIANLLLPGFVYHTLDGDSDLYGLMEMVATGGGIAAIAVSSTRKIAEKLKRNFVALLISAGLLFMALSVTTSSMSAIIIYGLAGMVWSVLRSGADGHLLEVVDVKIIGRVQAFTTLLTAVIGMLTFLMPILFDQTKEATLFAISGTMVVLTASGLGLWNVRAAKSNENIAKS